MPKLIHELVEKAALQATMQGGYVPKQDIARLIGVASVELQNYYLGRTDERKPGPAAGLNTRSVEALSSFLRRTYYRAAPGVGQQPMSEGRFTPPADCVYVDYYDIPAAMAVKQVEGHQLRALRFDPIASPTATYPLVTTIENGDKQIYPATLTSCDLVYYGIPPVPVYFEDYDADGNAVYDDSKSVDVGWGREHEPELLQRTLRLISQAIRDGQLSGTSGALTADNS